MTHTMVLEFDPALAPLRLFARARRIRVTHHRVSIPTATLAAVRAQAERHGAPGCSSTAQRLRLRTPRATPPPTEQQRRQQLARLLARRGRMSALIRGVREPRRHGALRKAILRLDASIIALRRALHSAA